MKKVYVVTEEPYHDNSKVLGIYTSIKIAQKRHPGDWRRKGFYTENWDAVAEMREDGRCLIREFELDACEREKPAFVIRCIFHVEPEKLDEHQIKDAFEQLKPAMFAFQARGMLELKA